MFVTADGETFSGKVNDDQITVNSGRSCTGDGREGLAGEVNLSCEDGCTIKFTHKDTSENDAMISVENSTITFTQADNETLIDMSTAIGNDGAGDLEIMRMFLTDGSLGFEYDTTNSWTDSSKSWDESVVIAANDEKQLDLELTLASGQTEFKDYLVVLSNSKENPVYTITLHSLPKSKPLIVTDPTVLDFGSSPPGYDNKSYFLVKNAGGAAGEVVDIKVTNSADGAFTLIPSPSSVPPFNVLPGYSAAVELNFKPIEGTHATPSNQVGQACVTWKNYNNESVDTCIDLLGVVKELEPACIDANPMEGVPGIWGLGELSGPGVKFGYIQIGNHSQRTIELTNCGDLPLELSGFAWNEMYTGPPLTTRAFVENSGDFVNRTLQRGMTALITVDFFPDPNQESVTQTAVFQFQTNAEYYTWLNGPPNPEAAGLVFVGMSGVGARRGVEVLPSKIDFGLITVDCCSRPEELTLYNIGDLPLEVAEVAIGAGSDNGFSLIGVESTPFTLGPDTTQSTRFKVKFCPDREGDFDGHVVIKSNDGANAEFIVPLAGEGTLLTHQIDEFVQITDPMVDILWVVDCSGSMGDEQDNLADNFHQFISDAVNWNAKLHVAVTSCDIIDESHSGNFQGNPKIIDTETMSNQDAINAFIDTMDGLGTSCDGGKEAGLEAAHLALSEPLISGGNAGFIREDAKLSIIFVSDEPDNSVADWDFFVDFFRSIKGMRNKNMIEAYAIVGDDPGGCSTGGEDSSASAGPRYINVADYCNIYDDEHFMSICETDYGPIYENLAENLFALRSQFFLSRLADPETIVVTINGSIDNSWEYDDPSNSIVFPMENPPAPGAAIKVEYDTLCLH